VRQLAIGEAGVHAVLLYGPTGSGKGELATALAQAWLCRQPTAEGADGECRACGAFERGNSSDFLRISPGGKSNLIRLASINPVHPDPRPEEEQTVPLKEFFRTSPLMSRHKVALIENAHRMNADASNALLKTLEEPHPHAKIVMTTDSVGGVLPTILSRCLAVACELPTEEELRRQFPEATEDDLRLSEGAPGRLRQILDRKDRYRRLADFARRLPHRKPGEALAVGDEFRAICEGLDAGGGARNANAEGLDLLAAFLAREPSADPRWTHLTIEAHRRILQNGSPGIVFDSLFSSMLRRRAS